MTTEEGTELSCQLFDVLETVGASERMRHLHRKLGKIEEMMQRLLLITVFNISPSIYRCGSYYEGTTTPDLRSDIDTLVCRRDLPIVLHEDDCTNEGRVVMYFDDLTRPGYVKLAPAVATSFPESNGDAHLITVAPDRRGVMCCKHHTVPDEEYTDNGPAYSYISEHGIHVDDFVAALSCDKVPPHVDQCLKRPRRHAWPPEDLLADMARRGCMVVGVGATDSDESALEWRLSFSLQERQLMTHLSPVQHKVYILLKMVKRDLIGPHTGGYIKSYHMKTCLFHCIENSPHEFWRKDNMIRCVLLCLEKLYLFVGQSFCPSFFVKEQNLFYKSTFRRVRLSLANVLKGILSQGQGFVFSLTSDKVGEILTSERLTLNPCSVTDDAKEFEFDLQQHTAILCLSCIDIIFNRAGPTDPEKIRTDLEKFINSEPVEKPLESETREAISHLLSAFNLRLAMSLAAEMLQTTDQERSMLLLNNFEYRVRLGYESDFVLAMIVTATILLKNEVYEDSFGSAISAANRITPDTISVCTCNFLRMREWKTHPNTKVKMHSFSVKDLMKKCLARCVVFLPFDEALVPDPLLGEKFRSVATSPREPHDLYNHWFGWVAVDAKIYVNFLLYLVSVKLGHDAERKVSVENIRIVLRSDHNLGHRETGYNILGWIYAQEDNIPMALECFLKSWQLRPHHNAAKFHVLTLCYREWERRRQDR